MKDDGKLSCIVLILPLVACVFFLNISSSKVGWSPAEAEFKEGVLHFRHKEVCLRTNWRQCEGKGDMDTWDRVQGCKQYLLGVLLGPKDGFPKG